MVAALSKPAGQDKASRAERYQIAMTEAEWLACDDPQKMLEFLRGKASDRKLRLLAVACHRRIWHLVTDKPISRKTLEFAERYADGLATRSELHGNAWGKRGSVGSAVQRKAWDAAELSIYMGAHTVCETVLRKDPELYRQREAAWDALWPNYSLSESLQMAEATMPADWLKTGRDAWTEERIGQCGLIRDIFGAAHFHTVPVDSSWLTAAARCIAETIYNERRFADLPILADALEEAGCTSAEILEHCRSGGEHFLGCWALDLVLGKE